MTVDKRISFSAEISAVFDKSSTRHGQVIKLYRVKKGLSLTMKKAEETERKTAAESD